MNFYLIGKTTAFDGINMTGYQSDMFHGDESENNIRQVIYAYGDILEEKIHLDVNLYNLADIIKPSRHLVVSEKIKKILSGEKNIAFLQVVFDKIINVPYKPGILPDTYEKLFTHQPYSFTSLYKHDPSLTIGNYYELIAPEIYEIEANYDDLTEFEFEYLDSTATFELKLSKTMLNDNPVIWTSEGTIFRDFVFEKIKDFFNWDYFQKREYNI
jgi:hypothetical protein